MKPFKRTTQVLAVSAVALAALFAGTAIAQASDRIRIVPPQPEPRVQLGFYGHMQFGLGVMVDRVIWGTPAWRAGLERGDLIVRINGRRIRNLFDYHDALRHCDGFVRLLVWDVRGRGLVPVTVALEDWPDSGPTQLFSRQQADNF